MDSVWQRVGYTSKVSARKTQFMSITGTRWGNFMKHLLMMLSTFSLLTTPAAAFCRAPGPAPQPPRSFDRPQPPECLRASGGDQSACDRYELDRYSDEVARYIKKLEDFVYDAERYADKAATYAACEADDARDSLGR